MTRPFGAVLTWDEHDRRHRPDPRTGRKLYLLDEAPDDPGLRHCNYCGAYVQPRIASDQQHDDDQA